MATPWSDSAARRGEIPGTVSRRAAPVPATEGELPDDSAASAKSYGHGQSADSHVHVPGRLCRPTGRPPRRAVRLVLGRRRRGPQRPGDHELLDRSCQCRDAGRADYGLRGDHRRTAPIRPGHGWGDNHPAGAPVVVVTHRPPPESVSERFPRTTFTGSVEDAVATAKHLAGDKFTTIASANIIQQALNLGLVDEIYVSLVPVLFGTGVRYFGELVGGHILLEDPTVVQGKRALHLRYPVRR